jgi:thioredoxin 1
VRFAPIYDKASDTYDNVVFGKVDTDAEQRLAATFNIRSIPTLMIIRDGVILYSQPGAISGSALASLIEQAQQLDMDAVRAEIAAEGASTPA